MTEIDLPEMYEWLLKMPSHKAVSRVLLADPVAFASFFAASKNVMPWPQEMISRIESMSNMFATKERMLDMIKDLDGRYKIRMPAETASSFCEGLYLHEYVKGNSSDCFSSPRSEAARLEVLDGVRSAGEESVFGTNLSELSDLLGFSKAEDFWVRFSIHLAVDSAFFMLMDTLTSALRGSFPQMLSDISGIPLDDLERALENDSTLVRSGMLSMQYHARVGFPTVSEFWLKKLSKPHEDGFASSFLVPFKKPESTGSVGRMKQEDEDILVDAIKGAKSKRGVNILVHGSRSIDKEGLVHGLLEKTGRKMFKLRSKEAGEQDWACICLIVQKMMSINHPNSVLVTDKTPYILQKKHTTFMSFFGMEEEHDDHANAPTMDEILLTENAVPVVWLVNSPKRLDEDSVGRFLFHAEIRKSSRKERSSVLEGIMNEAGWSEDMKTEVLKFSGVSEQQLKSAISLGDIFGKPVERKEEVMLHAIERSQKALDRRETDAIRTPITKYSLDYLCTAGRFRPEQIIQALKKRSSASLCFYGLPGTGKTQLAEHIAYELGKQLIMKRASDIYDKYLGESEKRVAEMFIEAEEEDAVLLLDEADSFLRDRSFAKASWEVTIVNELLQRMERFPGIFICATNLFKQLDTAALRRFMFKLEFLPLTERQRWSMFLNETGLDESSLSTTDKDELHERLLLINSLTPGDFAVVKRQCVLLEETLTPEQWIGQLEIEVKAKRLEIGRAEPERM